MAKKKAKASVGNEDVGTSVGAEAHAGTEVTDSSVSDGHITLGVDGEIVLLAGVDVDLELDIDTYAIADDCMTAWEATKDMRMKALGVINSQADELQAKANQAFKQAKQMADKFAALEAEEAVAFAKKKAEEIKKVAEEAAAKAAEEAIKEVERVAKVAAEVKKKAEEAAKKEAERVAKELEEAKDEVERLAKEKAAEAARVVQEAKDRAEEVAREQAAATAKKIADAKRKAEEEAAAVQRQAQEEAQRKAEQIAAAKRAAEERARQEATSLWRCCWPLSGPSRGRSSSLVSRGAGVLAVPRCFSCSVWSCSLEQGCLAGSAAGARCPMPRSGRRNKCHARAAARAGGYAARFWAASPARCGG